MVHNNRLIGVPMSEQTCIHEYDLAIGAEDAAGGSSGGEPEWYQEGRDIMGFVPGSKRFVLFSTLAEAICVWDIVTKRVVRSIDACKHLSCYDKF